MPPCIKCEETRVKNKPDFKSCENYKESKSTGCFWLRWNNWCDELWRYTDNLELTD